MKWIIFSVTIFHNIFLFPQPLQIQYNLCMLKVVNKSIVVLLTTFNMYKFYTHNGDDIP